MFLGALSLKFIDRYNRRTLLLSSWGVFALSTLMCAWAQNFQQLFFTRALVGASGSMALSIAMAIAIDITPPHHLGRVMAKIMTGFTLATVLGVPLVLTLSEQYGWQYCFLLIGLLAVVLYVYTYFKLPSSNSVLDEPEKKDASAYFLKQPNIIRMYILQALNQFSAFLIIPTLSAYLMFNFAIEREYLPYFYLLGGVVSFITIHTLGRIADNKSTDMTLFLGTTIYATGLFAFSFNALPIWLTLVCFVAFMAGNAGRNISLTTSSSRIPEPSFRARYMTFQGFVRDASITLASVLSSTVLNTQNNGYIENMPILIALSLLTALYVLYAHHTWFHKK
ncbi:Purine efflux pump PbuE [Ephemeroptericola cinctiostellae]|uniref:Purine efflux pump PbuE n=2 Tax=Ephemeroptericola cinctiostellae TaxID=2268024 RepID=A0A345DB57_9BURK|nr:Purine efflux pump PbuE [Ephemeroptericola cinctiostellae]